MLLNILDTFFEEYGAITMFAINSTILIILTLLFVSIKDNKKRWNKLNDYLCDVTKTVDSIRYGDLTKKLKKLDIPNSKDLTESLNRMIETLHDREIMIDEYQKELYKQNKILETTINSLSDGLVIVDENDKILRTTLLAAKWFNMNGKKLVGHKLTDFVEISNKKPIPYLEDDEVILFNNKNANFIANTIELNVEDKKKRYIVVIKDVTNQKELESLKEDFVATLTHDLKVPIIAETNMLELFLNKSFGDISEKQELALRNMQSSNKELLNLVQTVLDTYKVGNITLYKENFLLKSFINEIIEEMQPIAQKTFNNIEFNPQRDIKVYADKFQLKRVVKNLLQNAISYGKPKSPIQINIGEIPNFVTVKVIDYGTGIPQSDIKKIFNKYYSAAKKFRKIGTGLGLYLAHQLIKAHNGELTVESEEGAYTEFCIKIPVNYGKSFI